MIKKLIILGLLILSNNPVLAGFWTSGKITTVSTGGTSTVRNDGFDIVFGSATSELPSFRANWTTIGTATFWTKLTLATGNTTIYVYYNNSSALDVSTFSTIFTKNYEDTGLKGLWHLDEGTGVTTADSSGNGNTGTLVNGLTWQATDGGQWDGQANVIFNTGSHLRFDGVDDYVDIPDNGSLDFGISNSFTFEMWFKTTQVPGWEARFVTFRDAGNAPLIDIGINSSGNFILQRARSSDSSEIFLNSNTIVNNGNWYYGVVVRDVTNDVFNIYVDGVFKNSITDSTTGNFNTPTKRFGFYYDGSYYNGFLDEVRVYNRVLTQPEIKAHYERRKYAENVTITYGAEQNNPGTIYPAYSLRRPITINNTGTSILTNFQIEIPLRIGARGISILD